MRFANKNLNDKTIVDANAFKVASYSHTDAQNDYLLGYKKSTGYPAMLVEGVWWENEAEPTPSGGVTVTGSLATTKDPASSEMIMQIKRFVNCVFMMLALLALAISE